MSLSGQQGVQGRQQGGSPLFTALSCCGQLLEVPRYEPQWTAGRDGAATGRLSLLKVASRHRADSVLEASVEFAWMNAVRIIRPFPGCLRMRRRPVLPPFSFLVGATVHAC